MSTGRIFRLSNYCVVEYITPDPYEVQIPISADFTVFHNKYTGDIQFYNANNNKTSNIQDYTVTKLDGNTYINLDVDKVPNFLDYDDFVYYNPTTDPFQYDKIRFHFISGFRFDTFEALIVTIKNQMNNGKYGIFSSLLLNSLIMQDIVKFNSQPIFLTDAFFDKYFEITIPAIKQINTDYYTSSNTSTTLGAKLSPRLNATEDGFDGYIGYVTDFPINISLSESNTYRKYTPESTTYDTYIINNNFDLSINQTNDYDGISAEIRESEEGNYIEYAMLKYNSYPNEFIAYLNGKNINNNWIIIHELRVYEHIGSSQVLTNNSMYYQYSDFEQYLTYRPVLKYSNTAIAFSIDYTIRLTNVFNGEQIIRTGGITLYNPKSYGKDTRSLIANITAQPYKVYNKIIMKHGLDKTNMYVEPNFNDVPEKPASATSDIKYITKYQPYVIYLSKVGLSNHSAYDKQISSDTFIYGQGKCPLVISPMDNIFKFIIHEQDKDGVYRVMDLNIAKKYKLVFRTNEKEFEIKTKSNISDDNLSVVDFRTDTTKEKVTTLDSNEDRSNLTIQKTTKSDSVDGVSGFNSVSDGISELSDTKNGELLFKLNKKDAQVLYKSKSDEYFITMLTEDGTETVLYRGRWFKMSDDDLIKKKEVDARLDPIDIKIKAEYNKTGIVAPETTKKSITTSNNSTIIYDVEKNTVIADNPNIEVPGYSSSFEKNGNVSAVTKLTPKQVLKEEEEK